MTVRHHARRGRGSNVVGDTTPQLGGDLDVNGKKIVSTSNGNIDIEPNGTGNVLIGNLTFNADQTVGAGQDNYVLTYDNGTGEINLEAAAGGGLNNVVEDATPQLGGNLDLNSNTINGTGTIGITGAITATSYGGITEANLLDKSATETVSGAYTFTGGITVTTGNIVAGTIDADFDAVTATSYGGITEANLVDKTANEDISGNWSGSGTLDIAPAARSVTATGNTATTDYSKIIRFTSGSGQTFTLDGDPPTNAVILLDNSSGNAWTIAASTSLIWAKDASTGNRTLADDGIAVALHRGSGTWIINGSDLLT